MIIHFFLRCPCSLREQLRRCLSAFEGQFINKLSLDLNEGQFKKNSLKVRNLSKYVQNIIIFSVTSLNYISLKNQINH
jgi:hypothetical protein